MRVYRNVYHKGKLSLRGETIHASWLAAVEAQRAQDQTNGRACPCCQGALVKLGPWREPKNLGWVPLFIYVFIYLFLHLFRYFIFLPINHYNT